MTALLASARAIHFVSLMAIFGGSTYALLLRRGLEASPVKGTRVLFATSATLAVISGIVWFCLIAGQMSGSWRGSLDPATIELAATSTRFGHIYLGRLVGLAALWFMCAVGIRSHRLALPILAGVLLGCLGLTSHAAATGIDISSAGAINDTAHLLTAGFWFGGLLVLAMFLRQHWARPPLLLGALRLFSIWGTPAVAVLVVTGLINAVSILPVSEMSISNLYFDLLLVKVGLASVMIGLAALNRWRFAPALRTDGERATQRLAASLGSEIFLGLAVVSVAGLLGLTPPH
ncbi:MAG TPA: CopD family protein [Sphingomicrobium sp.]|jgi:putative copper resistance protein D|nr:CopD family protein [Sphingomicrobium sp.]